jgi:hypothetical protein
MTISFLERLTPNRPAAAPPVFDGLAQVRAYWEGLRRGSELPSRADLDPRGLAGVLDRVFLAERIGRGLAQVRICGSALVDFAGLDIRGLPLSCLFAPESRPMLAESLESVIATPSVAEIDLGSDRGAIGAVVARLLLLPLADDGDRKLLLGVISFARTDLRRCKLQVLTRREEQVTLRTASEVMQEPKRDAEQPTLSPAAKSGSETKRRFGHLTLVHSAE